MNSYFGDNGFGGESYDREDTMDYWMERDRENQIREEMEEKHDKD